MEVNSVVQNSKFVYPVARREENIVDDYHGEKIVDPYRWLEDADSEDTKQFVDAQNAVTVPFLEKCPLRTRLHDRLVEVWDHPKYGCPGKHASNYYYNYNSGLQNQNVLYKQSSLDSEASVFLDPNKLSPDGTISIRTSAFSEDGRYYAYGLSEGGSDWITVHIRDTESGEDLKDVLTKVKFSCLAWLHDNSGLFYNSYPDQDGKSDGTETTANLNQKLYFHLLGTDQMQDVLCGEWPENPNWMGGVEVSDCGRYVVCSIRHGCDPVNLLYFCDLSCLTDGIKGHKLVLHLIKLDSLRYGASDN